MILGLACGLIYALRVVHAASGWYAKIARPARGWRGRVHVADDQLGLAPRPNSRGAHTFPLGPDLPMRYDQDGLRVPVSDPPPRKRPLVLALGCSFTYGDACRAEDAFPYLVAARLGGTAQNAGVCGYGLAQMQLRARELIPRLRPDWVLVQYSPWLAARSASGYAPSEIGRVPIPRYVQVEGAWRIEPPAFRTWVFDLPFADYQAGAPAQRGFPSFLLRVGLPLCLHDDLCATREWFDQRLGRSPPPPTSEAFTAFAYRELLDECERAGAGAILVVLGGAEQPLVELPASLSLAGWRVARGDRALVEPLTRANATLTLDTYVRAYAHLSGNRVFDLHPNPRAHELIAAAVLEQARARERQR
ncbi:MAG: hypothetical protein AB7N76_02610 [Planctomycetota bacterium]